MPVYRVRSGPAVELVADIDEVLDGRDVDVVDRGEVKDDGFEGRFVGFDGDGLAATRARVVPGAILNNNVVRLTGRGKRGLGREGWSLRRVWGRRKGWCGGFL